MSLWHRLVLCWMVLFNPKRFADMLGDELGEACKKRLRDRGYEVVRRRA